MPYTSEQIRRSDYYINVEDADKRKHLKLVQEESQRLNISGSIDMIFKDADGTLLIYDWKRSKGIKKTNYFAFLTIVIELL